MQAREVSDEPLTVLLLPVKRPLPFFTIDSLPTFREPPAKVLIAAITYEFNKLSVADESLIDGKIRQEDVVRWLFIVESKIPFGVRRLVAALVSTTTRSTDAVATVSGSVPEPKQASFDFRHSFDCHRGWRPKFHWRGELIAQQV